MMIIGADFATKAVTVMVDNRGYDVILQIWDLAGQPRFDAIRLIYYSGANGALIMFDITRHATYENVIKWLFELQQHLDKSRAVPLILIGNKMDPRDLIVIDLAPKEGKSLAKVLPEYYCDNQFTIPYIETSAKSNENVEQVF